MYFETQEEFLNDCAIYVLDVDIDSYPAVSICRYYDGGESFDILNVRSEDLGIRFSLDLEELEQYLLRAKEEIRKTEEENIKDKARQEKNRYMREYRKKNPDKIRAINDRYWANKKIKEDNNAVHT